MKRPLLVLLVSVPALGDHQVDIPLMRSGSHPTQQGFVNITLYGAHALVEAWDDSGARRETTIQRPDGGASVWFNSNDLEEGNRDKGIWPGIGAGTGDWYVRVSSNDLLFARAYMRTSDGFVTAMSGVVRGVLNSRVAYQGTRLYYADDWYCGHRVHFFNPGSNRDQRSWLRVKNHAYHEIGMEILGQDSAGDFGSETAHRYVIPGYGAIAISARELEECCFGDGVGKWTLDVFTDEPVTVMSLLETPTGHLTNMGNVVGYANDLSNTTAHPSHAEDNNCWDELRARLF